MSYCTRCKVGHLGAEAGGGGAKYLHVNIKSKLTRSKISSSNYTVQTHECVSTELKQLLLNIQYLFLY